MSNGPLTRAHDGLLVAIRLSPGAKAERLLAVSAVTEGRCILKASVIAPAEGGRANEALLRMLARTWHLTRRDLSIVAGAGSRNKAVHIAGDPQQLIDKIRPEIASLPGW